MLLRIKVLLSVVFLALLSTVRGFEFKDLNNPNVTFGEVEKEIQQIYVDENNEEGRVSVVLITGVKGTLSTMIYNGENLLDLQFIQNGDGDQYTLEINTLDYETLEINSFLMDIYDDYGTTRDTKVLNIWINNLDDEPPTFTTSTCTMKENTTIVVENTTCIFTIYDPDGFLSKMDFTGIVNTENNESEIFLFTYDEIPEDTVNKSDVYLILQDGVLLDYEQIILYTFHIEVKDGAGHATVPLASIPIIVQVEDIGDMPPVWQSFTSMLRIDEHSEGTLTIRAKDGDYGINNPIKYDLGDSPNETTIQYISVGEDSGVITIHPIERDGEDGISELRFEVRAYEVGDEDSELVDHITIYIDDIDDNSPLLSVEGSEDKSLTFEIEENYSDELDYVIIVNDIDQGDNAMYTIELDSSNGIDYSTTFQIIPGRGYEETQLVLTIISAKKLDYEDDDWKIINFDVVSKGTKNISHTDTLPITINLIDINDEFPQFDEEIYYTSVYENVTIDTVIAYIKATDRDAEDIEKGVHHSLVGTVANSILSIEPLGGDIKTTTNNSFDYEKQTEVLVQVRAVDNADNTNNTQLVITVIDLNDEPPRMVVSSAIQIDENREDGYVLETSISATDDDATANLTFSIDWNESYATKNSRQLEKPEEIEQIKCIEVTTIEGENNQKASAQLSIKEVVPGNSPDYEVFDTLFIKLVVTDQNTQINRDSDSALIVINIGNLNDNPPVFIEGTASAKRFVNELATDGTPIGQVTATDADNLDPLIYSIKSLDSPNWIGIDSATGSLTVSLEDGAEIDCDYPNPLYYINYTVSVYDGDFTVDVDISIYINDVNDKIPQLDDDTFAINEDDGTTDVSQNDNTTIYTMKPTDDDRDEAFHTVVCSFQSDTDTKIRSRFKIENNEIKVALPQGTQLDREETPQYNFRINCIDDPNHTGINSNSLKEPASFTINLNDLNDKYPVITTNNIEFSENTEVNSAESIEIQDDDLGENGTVSYFNITKVQRFEKPEQVGEKEGSYDNLFSIEVTGEKNGTLKVVESLEGNYGYFLLAIETQDAGTPPLTITNELNIIVSKHNFKQPEFIFPENGKNYYLRPEQNRLSQLTLYNRDPLENFKATDNQQNKYNIKFSIISGNDSLFHIEELANSQAQLQMFTSTFDENKIYELGIMAQLDTEDIRGIDEAPYSVNCTISIGFFDDNTDPVFDYDSIVYHIPENDENITIPLEKKAKYPDIEIEGLLIYYLLNPESDTFEVDIDTGTLRLKVPLDYETINEYNITIQASNSKAIKPNASPDTKLAVTINVTDVNDNPPVFDKKNYFAPILSGSGSQTDVVTVTATDIDTTSQGKLRYSIADWVTTVPNFNISDPFGIDNYGQIKLQFVVTDDMKNSYFTLTVICQDEGDLQDDTTVKIYTVTSENTVNFKFNNELQSVKDKTNDISAVLNTAFGYNSNVESAKSDTSTDETDGPITVAPIYFVNISDSVEAVKGTEILKLVTNVTIFNQLKTNFSSIGLTLMNFASKDETNENLQEMLKMWLIGVSVVLGALCLCLLVAFILKTRVLNQRIKNLSSTKFGSQESGLNRTGVTAPTTNKHAIEGSNPVYSSDDVVNERKDFDDRRSVTSGDSELIGVEDDDKFGYGENEKNKEMFE